MASLPRPATGLKKHSMRPPNARAPISRTQSSTTSQQARSQSRAVSPAESTLSTLTNNTSRMRSPSAQSNGGTKRKEREFDGEGGEETNIHVVVRCRGRSDREVRENSGIVVSTNGTKGKSVELSMGPSALSNKTYHFDKVFSPAADQTMIYDDVVTPILDEVLENLLLPQIILMSRSRCSKATTVPSLHMAKPVRGRRTQCPETCQTH